MLLEINSGLLLVIIGVLLRKDTANITWRQKHTAVVVDSCALIDGRILAITDAHFMPKHIIIPQFILHELQLLADGKDAYKRERARFGLDIAHQLQQKNGLTVTVDQLDFKATTIDDKLIALAKKRHADLYTTDLNLNKVAVIGGVSVLNVNALAQTLRIVLLPGETVTVKLMQRGKSHNQAIGYLDDGTMVVVDAAGKLIGKTVPVIITGAHQTVAGKMAFGKFLHTQ